MALGLTLLAGASTALGGAMAMFFQRTRRSFLAGSLGFSGGLMVYISLVEILPKARTSLIRAQGESLGPWIAVGSFLLGVLLTALIDALIPKRENPHEPRKVEEITGEEKPGASEGVGFMAALAIFIHNFPEGMATFFATMADVKDGLSVALAVVLHNIPEGIAVFVPVYLRTGSKRKLFWFSAASGMSEPLEAILGYTAFAKLLGASFFRVAFGFVAGIMVFISLDELLPLYKALEGNHIAVYSWIGGMAAMALSLLLMA